MNKYIFYVIIAVLIIVNIFTGYQYFVANKKLQGIIDRDVKNANIVSFSRLFIEKVLKTQGEISYQDRLKLEGAVLATTDDDIVGAWNKFLESTTEAEAQDRVLALLTLFPNKLSY
jgi:hypothetical protein